MTSLTANHGYTKGIRIAIQGMCKNV